MESRYRSLVKAASYRVIAMTMVFAIALLFTRDVAPAAKIGLTAAIAKTTLYYLWERLWDQISWGRASQQKPNTSSKYAPSHSERNRNHSDDID